MHLELWVLSRRLNIRKVNTCHMMTHVRHAGIIEQRTSMRD